MTDAHTEEQAALYVLGALRDSELREFEVKLDQSPELRDLVRQMSSALHAPVRQARGPARMHVLEKIHATLETSPASPSRQRSRVRRFPWAVAWGIAASLLFIVNLFLVSRGGSPDSPAEDPASVQTSAGTGGIVPPPPEEPARNRDREVLEARIESLVSDVLERDNWLETIWRDKQELVRENEVVKAYNQDWQREYNRLAARVMPFFESNGRMSRFTVIELVDTHSLDRPGTGVGFADLAGRFLTGEASIAQGDGNAFVGPMPPEDQAPAAPTLAAVARDGVDRFTGDKSSGGPVPPPEAAENAVGFTVWRDDEQKGFLDLYNLSPAEEGKPFLWVRGSEMEPYLPVGFIPVSDNGTGSFFYSVEEPEFTPTEILITAEPEGLAREQPAGSVLLKGP